ncbi:DUF5018-related domain-containing protein [Phocaeicola sp.]
MKKLLNMKWLVLLLCLPFITSCNEDLPAYENAEITKVGFYHRYVGSDKDAITGEGIVVAKELGCSYDINSEAATVECIVTVPDADNKFTESERGKVSQNKLWGYFNVSTAAHVTPIEGAPTLGTPGDWTHENKYIITAANGTKKTWTVRIKELKR